MPEMEFKASLQQLGNVLGFVDEQLEICGCPVKTAMQIDVAVEEIFVNIASYSYPDSEGKMLLSFDSRDGTAVIRFSDSGIEFNPLAKDDPDVTLSAQERQIGGLGIYMVKKSMDDISYKYEDGRNILTISKKLRETE